MFIILAVQKIERSQYCYILYFRVKSHTPFSAPNIKTFLTFCPFGFFFRFVTITRIIVSQRKNKNSYTIDQTYLGNDGFVHLPDPTDRGTGKGLTCEISTAV